MKILASLLLASLVLTGCESTKAVSTPRINVFINGRPYTVQDGNKIIYRENGRLVPMRIEE